MTVQRYESSAVYSKVTEANGFVFTAGVIPTDLSRDVEGQTAEVLTEIDRLLVTISVDPAGDYELDSVATHLGISARHLARLFKAQVGVTLRQYVHEVRLENAVGLVLAGESFHAAAATPRDATMAAPAKKRRSQAAPPCRRVKSSSCGVPPLRVPLMLPPWLDDAQLRMRRSHWKSRLVTTSSMRRSLLSRLSNLRLMRSRAPVREVE